MTEQKKRKIELLAPAGSFETFMAVIRAGADAVYLGGSQFGARAYADNFSEEELLAAIDYAHMHGRQVYLTVNTLFKEEELLGQLYDYLLPYYKQGLDAVIVQDMGALSLIRDELPGMDIHTSTQMTVTSCEGAAYMKSLGASRVVTAREMSLAEIRRIHETVDIEIESFVHGALCYCYSGQCLLSSMLGGRSGNRGRCAQPCRLPYEVLDERQCAVKTKGNYVLSPKDLCTVSDIPQLVRSGIYSFKIEGRMKQAEYAAGVVAVYRKYMDAYLSLLADASKKGLDEEKAYDEAAAHFKVAEADQKKLLDLGNRSGFTDGYYKRHNGSEMITFGKPNHVSANEALQAEIREKYIHPKSENATQIKEKIKGILRLKKDIPAMIELTNGTHTVTQTGDVVQQALKQPLSREKVDACMQKTGNTPFVFETFEIEMEEDIFMPVQALNQLRRDGLKALEERMLAEYRRTGAVKGGSAHEDIAEEDGRDTVHLAVSVENRAQAKEVLSSAFVDDIYYDSLCYDRDTLFEALGRDAWYAQKAGKKAYYILPAVFRDHTEEFYQEHLEELLGAHLNGVVVKSYDAAAFVARHLEGRLPVILDHSIYSWNSLAKQVCKELHPLRDTAPLELNKKELFARDNRDSEILIYGYLPLMTSAQCVHKNTVACDRKRTVMYLKDRYGKHFPVKNNCTECYNTIYNTTPLLLFGVREELERMRPAGYRISFTIEKKEQVREILDCFEQTFLTGKRTVKELFAGEYTNGHYKRGVE